MKNNLKSESQLTPEAPGKTKKPIRDQWNDFQIDLRRFIMTRTVKHNVCLLLYVFINLTLGAMLSWKHTLGILSQVMFLLSILMVALFDTVFTFHSPSKRKLIHLTAFCLNVTSCALYVINTISTRYAFNLFWWRIGTAMISSVPFSPIQYLYFSVTLSTLIEAGLVVIGRILTANYKQVWIRLIFMILYLVAPLPAMKAYTKVKAMLDKMILKSEVYEVVEEFVKSAQDEMLLKERKEFKTESIFGGPRKVIYKVK